MQITLQQKHIEAAVRAYVAKAGIEFPVEDIDFTAGRGKSGLTATVEVQDPFAADSDGTPAPEQMANNDPKPEPKAESKPKAKASNKPESQPATEEANEPAQAEEPPFSPDEAMDSANDTDEPAAPAAKGGASLFG